MRPRVTGCEGKGPNGYKLCKHGHERTPENVNKSGNCKICARERASRWYLEHPDNERRKNLSTPIIGPNGYKLCKHGHEKTPENMYKDGKCKQCLSKREKDRYYADPSKKAAMVAAWRLSNAGKVEAKSKEWRLANADKIAAASREWCRANPEAKKRHKHNRRSRLVGVGGTLSKGLSDKLLKLQKGKCRICKVKIFGTKYCLDHIIPISKGGPNIDTNIQLLCPTCNLKKGAKLPESYALELGMLFC